MLGERPSDVGEQLRAVERLHLDARAEDAVRRASSHSTSISRSRDSPASAVAFEQSSRCTETPRPRVTKPMIASPGTGVQHGEAHHHVVEALDVDARAAPGAGAGRAGPQHGRRELLLARRREVALQALDDAPARSMALADRRVERVEVRRSELGRRPPQRARGDGASGRGGPRGEAP